MASDGTSSPSAADTFFILMRDPVRESSWLKLTFLRDTAAYSLIGMLTSPKLIARSRWLSAYVRVFPTRRRMNRGTAVGRLGRRVLIGALALVTALAACS